MGLMLPFIMSLSPQQSTVPDPVPEDTIRLHGGTFDSTLKLQFLCNNNLFDSSGNGFHGTNTGATIGTDRNAKANSAWFFDGTNNDRIQFANDIIDVTQSFTILMSIRPETESLTGTKTLWNNDNGTSGGVRIRIIGGNIVVGIPGGTAWTSTLPVTAAWHWVAVTFNAATGVKTVYVDSTAQTVTGSTPANTGTSQARLGVDINALTNQYRGKIDELHIYQRALSADELTLIRTTGGLYDNTAEIQAAMDSLLPNVIFETGYFRISEVINISQTKNVVINAGVTIQPLAVFDGGAFTFGPDSKTIISMFRVDGVDGFTLDCQGVLNGLQDGLESFGFMKGFTFYQCENVEVIACNVEQVHDGVFLIDVDDSEFHLINYTNAPSQVDHKDACLSVQFANNLLITQMYCDGGEECVDLNGDCDNITLDDIEGDNVTQAVLELNMCHNITANNIRGNQLVSDELVRFDQYVPPQSFGPGYTATFENRNVTITNIEGESDFVDMTGTPISDQSIPA